VDPDAGLGVNRADPGPGAPSEVIPSAPAEIPVLLLRPGEDALRAWAASIPAGTPQVFVRFPRDGDLPLAVVQRMARRAAVIVDAAPKGPEDVLDLSVAGAFGLVAWLQDGGDVAEMGEAMGDGFLVGCRTMDLAKGLAIARELEAPILLEADVVPAMALDWHGYCLDLAGSPPLLRKFGTWPKHEATTATTEDCQEDDADPDASGEDEAGGEDGPESKDGS